MEYLSDIFYGTLMNSNDSVHLKRKHYKVGFEDVQQAIQKGNALLINTLPFEQQDCLVEGSVNAMQEVEKLNDYLEEERYHETLIVYGLNHTDESVERKQKQLQSLGFRRVFVYLGGMFEWLLLQEIYGGTEFPTTSIQTDLLRFKPTKI